MSVVLIIAGINKYKGVLMFWKYNTSRIVRTLDSIESIKDNKARLDEYSALLEKTEAYCLNNPADKEGFILYAKVLHSFGDNLSGKNFEEILINGDYGNINPDALKNYSEAIKYINKSRALSSKETLNDEEKIMLAMLYFYTGYYDSKDISALVNEISEPENLMTIKEKRFFAMVKVQQGKVDEGIDFLNKYGKIKSVNDKLFVGGIYILSKQYTNAIMLYKGLLETVNDNLLADIINYNLGYIYYNQLLYNEAIAKFEPLYANSIKAEKIKPMLLDCYNKTGNTEKFDLLSK